MKSPLVYLQAWQKPLILLATSAFYCLMTLVRLPISPSLWSWTAFRNKWFGMFWRTIGPQMAGNSILGLNPCTSDRLLVEPVQDPYIDGLLKSAKGVVLELGPGTGDQARHFDPQKIRKLYGAEPNRDLHEQLLEKTAKAGISEQKYQILSAGAEPKSLIPALQQAGLLDTRPGQPSIPADGIFDTIVAIKSLCSIDPHEMRRTVETIYNLLKPGGEFLFFEHVHSDADPISAAFVSVTNTVWPYLMGNCHLDSKLDKIVEEMDGWAPKDVKRIKEYEDHHVFRYVYGRCRRGT